MLWTHDCKVKPAQGLKFIWTFGNIISFCFLTKPIFITTYGCKRSRSQFTIHSMGQVWLCCSILLDLSSREILAYQIKILYFFRLKNYHFFPYVHHIPLIFHTISLLWMDRSCLGWGVGKHNEEETHVSKSTVHIIANIIIQQMYHNLSSLKTHS